VTALDLPSWLQSPLDRLLGMKDVLPHALLIEGPRGVGKGILARAFAAALLCERPTERRRACGACPACGWFLAGNHPDVRLLAPADDSTETPEGRTERARHEIKIEQVRELADFVTLGSHRAGRKIVLADPADTLNMAASNALLKTLEEPEGQTVFLLVAPAGSGLVPTIRSRCVAFPVAAPARDEALAWLLGRLPDIAPAEVGRWLDLTSGAPLAALAFAEPAAATAHRLLLQAVAAVPETGALKLAEGFGPVPAAIWLPQLQGWVSDLARVCAGASALRHPTQAERLGRLAGMTRLERVCGLATWLDRQVPVLEHPLNARLFAEDAWIRYEALFAGD
jgi:DNA polymerase-3 subunit delta'